MKLINDNHGKFVNISIHSKPFWSSELTELYHKLKDARKDYSIHNTAHKLEHLKDTKAIFDLKRKELYNAYMSKKADEVNQSNATVFWKKFNRLCKSKVSPSVDSLVDEENNLISDEIDSENILYKTFFSGEHLINCNFDSQFKNTIESQYIDIMNENIDPFIFEHDEINSPVTDEELSYAIKNYSKTTNSFDDENIHPLMFNHLGPVALFCIKKLFNLCLASGIWIWNDSRIIFMKKDGKKDYSKASNYRPISITSYIGKLFEKILAQRIENKLFNLGLFDLEQEGFCKQRNTLRYLNRLILDINFDKKLNKTIYFYLWILRRPLIAFGKKD